MLKYEFVMSQRQQKRTQKHKRINSFNFSLGVRTCQIRKNTLIQHMPIDQTHQRRLLLSLNSNFKFKSQARTLDTQEKQASNAPGDASIVIGKRQRQTQLFLNSNSNLEHHTQEKQASYLRYSSTQAKRQVKRSRTRRDGQRIVRH